MAFALSNFVPTNVISALMIEDLRKNLVFGGLVTVSTPDQIGRGSSYKIPGVGSITVRDYAGSDITIDAQADIGVTITVDQEKYFAFYADYVDSAEVASNVLPAYIDKATYSLANSIDTYIATAMVSSAANVLTSATIDETNVLDWFANVQEKFDLANVPKDGRWVVVPTAVTKALLKANVLKNMQGADLAVGSIVNVFGIDVYQSNNLPTGVTGTKTAIGGVASAANLVMTLRDVESVVATNRFATVERGLVVFGAAVNNWSAIVNGDVK